MDLLLIVLRLPQSPPNGFLIAADSFKREATAASRFLFSTTDARFLKKATREADETLLPSRPGRKDSVLGRSRAECTQVRAANAAHRHNASGAMG